MKKYFSLPLSMLIFLTSIPVFSQNIVDLADQGNTGDFDLSGDVLVAGYFAETSKLGFFYRDESGAWVVRQSFEVSGARVAIEADVAVTQTMDETGTTITVYRQFNGSWEKSESFSGPGSIAGRGFVDVSDNQIALAFNNDIYIYQYIDAVWQLQILESIPGRADMSLHANTLVIGASISNRFSANGRVEQVLVYRRTNGEWIKEADFEPPTPQFGHSVSVSVYGDVLLVGIDSGLAIFYERNSAGEWLRSQLVERELTNFGNAVALNENSAVIAGFDYMAHYKRDSSGVWQDSGGLSQQLINSGTYIGLGDNQIVYRVHGSIEIADINATCFDSDPVGDGWGWNGVSSCTILRDPIANFCDYSAAQDNLGWGWNAYRHLSCAPLTNTSSCYETGVVGDGWGWNGTESCRL